MIQNDMFCFSSFPKTTRYFFLAGCILYAHLVAVLSITAGDAPSARSNFALQHHPRERSISLEVAFQASTTTNCSSSNLSTIPGGCLSTAAHHGPQGEVMGISGWHPMQIFTSMVAAALVSLTRKHIFSLTVFALHLSFLNLAFA